MSDLSQSSDSFSPTQNDEDNSLLSERFDEFKEALEMLYILANISGRIQFAQKWPAAAAYIFGDALIRCDEEGTDDREQRAELEQKAEQRRIDLLEVLDGIEEKSVEKGVLQVDYVRGQIEAWGRAVALLIYGRKIVDKFIAPPPEPVQEEAFTEDAVSPPAVVEEVQPVETEPVELADPGFIDPLDAVRPIDVVAPASTQSESLISPPVGTVSTAPIEETSSPVMPPASQTQKAVSMKFVSSKDKKDDSDSAPPEDQA